MLAARPTLDLWSNTQIIPLTHGHPINVNTLMASLVLVIGGAYICERGMTFAGPRRSGPSDLWRPGGDHHSVLAGKDARDHGMPPLRSDLGHVRDRVHDRAQPPVGQGSGVRHPGSCIVPVAVAWNQVLGSGLQRGNDGFFRAHGTLVVVDAFGIFLALIITFGTALTLSRFSKWSWVLWIATPFVIFALVNSYGRTGDGSPRRSAWWCWEGFDTASSALHHSDPPGGARRRRSLHHPALPGPGHRGQLLLDRRTR